MSEYLTKEEVRQWRSSLERITLEEFAARLGKSIQGEKQTNDMIDKVMTHSLDSMGSISEYKPQGERLQTITLKSMFEHKEPEVKTHKETTVIKEVKEIKKVKEAKENKETAEKKEAKAAAKNSKVEKNEKKETAPQEISLDNNGTVSLTFKKPLIPREQMIFDYLLKNKGTIVYAKDMAALLELPRDYVYKYIKNLRQKLNEDVLYNADNGGYVLKV